MTQTENMARNSLLFVSLFVSVLLGHEAALVSSLLLIVGFPFWFPGTSSRLQYLGSIQQWGMFKSKQRRVSPEIV